MAAVLSEQFRDSDTAFLSPARVAEAFGYRMQELADLAHVHRNTLSSAPHSQRLQTYLRDLLRVLAVAESLTGDRARAVFLIRNEPLRPFDYKHADDLIREGRTDDVIAFLQSLAYGANG